MKIIKPRKLSFKEAWETTTEFFIDSSVETEIDRNIDEICVEIDASGLNATSLETFTGFLQDKKDALDVVLADIGLSRETFKRIVTLLRRKGRLPGGYDSEWDIKKIKKLLPADDAFAGTIANVLFHGNEDPFLQEHLPRYYREKLNWKEISVPEKKKTKIKESIYNNNYAALRERNIEGIIEGIIERKLEAIKREYGIDYGRGRSRIVDVDVDWAIPGVDDPNVIIMVLYYETNSIAQTTKARDAFNAYSRIRISNYQDMKNRVFVNFVDGGGWLARRAYFERLVGECHYFLNLKSLDMLEGIVLEHINGSLTPGFSIHIPERPNLTSFR